MMMELVHHMFVFLVPYNLASSFPVQGISPCMSPVPSSVAGCMLAWVLVYMLEVWVLALDMLLVCKPELWVLVLDKLLVYMLELLVLVLYTLMACMMVVELCTAVVWVVACMPVACMLVACTVLAWVCSFAVLEEAHILVAGGQNTFVSWEDCI